VAFSISAGISKIANGVEGVGIIVAVGGGVFVGTAVGGATVSVAGPPQALKRTIIRIVNRKFLTRTAHTPKNKNDELYCLILRKQAGGASLKRKETHGCHASLWDDKKINLPKC
jgi:hypothetical protein